MKKELEKTRRELRKAKKRIRSLEDELLRKPSYELGTRNVTTTLNGHKKNYVRYEEL